MKIHNPILTSTDILKIKNMHIPGFKVAVIPILYPAVDFRSAAGLPNCGGRSSDRRGRPADSEEFLKL